MGPESPQPTECSDDLKTAWIQAIQTADGFEMVFSRYYWDVAVSPLAD
jgi:hypothetical protein